MLLDPSGARRALESAARGRYAILAVNADSHAAISDCLEAALSCRAPIIIETSLWQLSGRSFGIGDPVLGLTRYLADLAALANSDRFRDVPVLFHTDHIKGPETLTILGTAIRGIPADFCGSQAQLRASSISLDSSEFTEDQNIATLLELCRIAADADAPLTLEMEAGVDDGVTPLETADRLLRAVESAHPGRIALWAPGVGTKHGLSADGMPAFSADAVRAHRDLAAEITGRDIGIALHGSSGLSNTSLQAAVQAGVAKVNWSSESLLIRSQAARAYYAAHGSHLEPGHPRFKNTAMDTGLQNAISEAYIPKLTERIRILGAENKTHL